MYETERQHIDISGLRLDGRILDVGGGGEAVISRRFWDRVVAIDSCRRELEETPDIGLKIVMNACEMGFLDGVFDNVTSFFTLMYMGEQETREFLREARRVLKPGGHLWIWDAIIPETPEDELFILQLKVTLSQAESITTGYGVRRARGQSAEAVITCCEQAGFTLESAETTSCTFWVRARR